MEKPEVYQLQYRTVRPTLYLMVNGTSLLPDGGGGVLAGDQLVWTKEVITDGRKSMSALAYADQLGLILLDPRWLKRVGEGL